MNEEAIIARVKAEQAELATRIVMLEDFIEKKAGALVSATHTDMLAVQLHAMKLYHHILAMRLADLRAAAVASTDSEYKTTAVHLDEPIETGGHDLDRDGPIPFNG